MIGSNFSRAAIEGLRSGVPSRHAVAQLGTTQAAIREAFELALAAVEQGDPGRALVVRANFGFGKTHLLEYLESVAESRDFATSYIVASPEMPLGNGHVVLKSLAENARAPRRTGKALRALAGELRPHSPQFAELRSWADGLEGLNDRFRAMLHLYEEFTSDPELLVQILGDFEGKPLAKTVLNQKLKELNAAAAYDLKGGPRNHALAHDRIQVFTQMVRACGCHGLVVLIDEVERIAHFSKKQRLAAYEELGWWARVARQPGSGIIPVLAMTSTFATSVVYEDEQKLVGLQQGLFGGDERDELAREGIQLLKDGLPLTEPTEAEVEAMRYRIKSLYQEAYRLAVPDYPDDHYERTTPIRQRIRRWITQWDLHRFYPEEAPDVEVEDVVFDQHEIGDDELATNGDDE
jgi:hypothetical protein